MTQACNAPLTPCLKQLTFADFTQVIQVKASTPKKPVKTADKKRAAEQQEDLFDCSKNAAMKCRCCIHTNGKSTWFPSCPRTLRVGEEKPKVQEAYGKATVRELASDVAKYSCKYWERGLIESCYTCGHHAHTDVLERSCPQLKGVYRDGEEADKLLMKSRRVRCPTWTSKADMMETVR